jgi:PAS domain-containing protein
VADHACYAAPELQAYLRQLRRFARTRFPTHDHHLVTPDGARDFLASADAGPVSRALIDQSPFSTVIYDAAGHPLAVNDAIEALWGVGLDSVLPGYSVLSDPELQKLMQKMTVREDPEFNATYPEGWQCRIEVVTGSGERKSAHVKYFKGHSQAPLTDSELERVATVFDTNELPTLYARLRVLRYEDVEAKPDFGAGLNRVVRLLAQKDGTR